VFYALQECTSGRGVAGAREITVHRERGVARRVPHTWSPARSPCSRGTACCRVSLHGDHDDERHTGW